MLYTGMYLGLTCTCMFNCEIYLVHSLSMCPFEMLIYTSFTFSRALIRPGRFDNQIHIHLPDIRARYNILKVHAKKVKLASGLLIQSYMIISNIQLVYLIFSNSVENVENHILNLL